MNWHVAIAGVESCLCKLRRDVQIMCGIQVLVFSSFMRVKGLSKGDLSQKQSQVGRSVKRQCRCPKAG